MVNYFDFFGLPVSYAIDESNLKKLYYRNSRSYHPDHHAQASFEEQEDMLQKSTINNQAYKTLSKQDSRIQHILELYAKIGADIKTVMPQMFLMDMMDINEQVMELQMDFDEKNHASLLSEIEDVKSKLDQEVEKILSDTQTIDQNHESLEIVKDYYLKRKYVKRLEDNIRGIDPEL